MKPSANLSSTDASNKPTSPSIWVDADACPVVIRDMLFRAASRTGVQLTLVANHYLKTPATSNIHSVQVQQGFDVADNEIVKRCHGGDLVITSDIPLADEVITKKALALSPRGEVFDKDNIKARLTMRNFMETMRSSGIQTQGPAALDNTDKMRFANRLDQWLQKNT